MRRSSTCRSVARWGLSAGLLCGLLAVPRGAAALDPARQISQYLFDQWSADRGFPGGAVHAVTQSADGYLWIATEKGLVRFDGLTFTLHVPPPGPAGSGPGVLGLAPADDGSIWTRLRGPMLLRHHQRAFERLEFFGDTYTVVSAMVAGREGLLLSPLGQGVLTHRNGRLTPRVPQASMRNSFVTAMAEDADGVLWLGTRDAGLLRVRSRQQVTTIDGLPDRKVNAVQPATALDVWIATDGGVVQWVDGQLRRPAMPPSLQDVPALALVRDRDANVWVALGPHGVVRLSPDGRASALAWDARRQGDARALFEDRNGNLWVGTTRGLARLRDGAFRVFGTAQGLLSDTAGPVFVDEAGRVWFGPPEGGLYWMGEGRVHRVAGAGIEDDVVYSIHGRDGTVWVGRQRGGLTRVRVEGRGTEVRAFRAVDGLAQDSVFAVHAAEDGRVWAGTLSAGVSVYERGTLTTLGATDGLVSNTVTAVLETRDGAMWFGTPSGVSVLAPAGRYRLTAAEGLPSNEVHALLQDRRGVVWIGTAAGLARVDAASRRAMPVPGLPGGAVVGLAEDGAGRLWIAAAEELVRVSAADLQAGRQPLPLRRFAAADGLPSTEGVRRHRTLVADPDGTVWFSSLRGLVQAMPPRAARDDLPVTAALEDVVTDDGHLALGEVVEVPPRTRRVTLHFGAASLGTPERLRFRYRLDDFDTGWSAPTSERGAPYTNLPPGTYEFRVLASSDGETWTGDGTRVRVRVAPAYWQTAWFQGAVVLGLSLVGWGLYRRRVGQVARQLSLAFEARLAERTRVAQELHDTLLQGCLSAKMQLHVAADRLPDDLPVRASLERVLLLMQQVIQDGRAAVQGLRTGVGDAEALEHALARSPDELLPDADAGFRVVVDGRPRAVHPMIRDEVYRIGREAIANALRHAGARHIEVDVQYAAAQLRVAVRDDGRGISAPLLRHGREGHFGLQGMRERAQAIGADLRVLSREQAGTEIEIVVPARLAYANGSRGGARWWWPWPRRGTAVGALVGEDGRSER